MIPEYLKRFVAFDVESTGLGPDARIVEFAAVLFCDGQPAGPFASLIYPSKVDWEHADVIEALKVNGLSKQRLVAAPTFSEIARAIGAFMAMAEIKVAHNAVFDVRMVDQEQARTSADPNWQINRCAEIVWRPCPLARVNTDPGWQLHDSVILDTMLLDFALVEGPQKHDLDSVCARWCPPVTGRHRALDDAMACGKILWAMASWQIMGRLQFPFPQTAAEALALQDKARPLWQARHDAKQAEQLERTR